LVAERARRLADIRLMQPYFEAAAKRVPSTPAGKQAALLLAELR
jgi:hypothetical protein